MIRIAKKLRPVTTAAVVLAGMSIGCSSTDEKELDADLPAPAGKLALAPDISLEEKLAFTRDKLLRNQQSKAIDVYIVCKKAADFQECFLQGLEQSYISLKQHTQPRLLLSTKQSVELMKDIPESGFAENAGKVFSSKAKLGCAESDPKTPPFPEKGLRKCSPIKWMPTHTFAMNQPTEQVLATVMQSAGKEMDEVASHLEDHPNSIEMTCKNIIVQNSIGCSISVSSLNYDQPLRVSLARRSYADLRKNWIKLQRLSGVVGPVKTPFAFRAPLSCIVEEEKISCSYKFVGGYDI